MPEKKIKVLFFKTLAGNEPVKDWLNGHSSEEKKSIGEDIKLIEFSWPIGVPLVKKLDTDLWEVRTHLPDKISRVFFTVWNGYMVLLHGIIKKSQKTPKEELELAKKRRNTFLKEGIANEK